MQLQSGEAKSYLCGCQIEVIKCNASFLFDQSCVKHMLDARVDLFGTWKNNGSHPFTYNYNDQTNVFVPEANGKYHYRRSYFHNKACPTLFKAVTEVFLTDTASSEFLVCVQYKWSGQPQLVTVSPHGNAKRIGTPHRRSNTSLINALRDSSNSPNQKTYHEQSLTATSLHELPKSPQQVGNLRRPDKHASDPWFLAIQLLQGEDSQNPVFRKFVLQTHGPSIILYSDRQLHEIVQVATKIKCRGILSADVLFPAGKFWVLALQYLHPLINATRSGQEPVMLGPILITKSKLASAYSELFGKMFVDSAGASRDMSVLTTDGEVAIGRAANMFSPNVYIFRGPRHLKDDLERKFKEVNGIDDEKVKSLWCSIKKVAETAISPEQARISLNGIDPRFFTGEFYSYLERIIFPVVTNSMLLSSLQQKGVMYKRLQATDNYSECVNSVMKKYNCMSYKDVASFYYRYENADQW